MLKIGEFSGLSRISIRMLRYYDENGLLCPAYIDETSGYRYYEECQLVEAARIAAMRDIGFGVALIGEIIRGGERTLERALRQRRKELLEDGSGQTASFYGWKARCIDWERMNAI